MALSKTQKATRHPTAIDLAWAAGFIDGEGSIAVAKPTKNGGGQRVSAAQKGVELLLRLQEMFGGSIGHYRNNTIYHWYTTGPRARGIMLTLYKFMSAKRRAEILKALGHATASAPVDKEQPRGTQDHSPQPR